MLGGGLPCLDLRARGHAGTCVHLPSFLHCFSSAFRRLFALVVVLASLLVACLPHAILGCYCPLSGLLVAANLWRQHQSPVP